MIMEQKELVNQLRTDGAMKGLCQLYQLILKGSRDIEALVKLFIKGIDFCVKNDYPTLEFMRQNFKGKSEPYGGFVDDEVVVDNLPNAVLNGECKGKLKYTGYSVSRLILRHTSKAAVNVEDHAYLTIDVFDNSHLYLAVAGTNAEVSVNVYGDAQVDCDGSGIKVVNKNKNTY